MINFSLPASDWWDWSLSSALSAGQLFFTVAGFSVAIWQLVRTANASVASRDLLENVRKRLLGNDLLVTLPELHKLDDELDEAIKGGEPLAVEKVLVRYTRTAGRISGLLGSSELESTDTLAALLAQATKAAMKAKAEISEVSTRTVIEITKVAVGKVSAVSVETSSLMARLEKRLSD